MEDGNLTSSRVYYVPAPHVPEEEIWKKATVIVYIFLLVIGVIGNSIVLVLCCPLLRRTSPRPYSNIIIYVFTLSLADMLVLCSLPLTIGNAIRGSWEFGSFACKLNWFLESFGKVFSAFVLATISCDRYLHLHCRESPIGFLQAPKYAWIVVLIEVAMSATVFCPLSYLSDAFPLDVGPRFPMDDHWVQFVVTICRQSSSHASFSVLIVYTCIVGFFLPATILSTLYTKILCKLRSNSETLAYEQIPIRKIEGYFVGIVVFYFVCAIPYWLSVLLSVFVPYMNESEDSDASHSDIFVTFAHIIHLLPYISSAFNWVWYGLINKRLRCSDNRSSSNAQFRGVGEDKGEAEGEGEEGRVKGDRSISRDRSFRHMNTSAEHQYESCMLSCNTEDQFLSGSLEHETHL